MASVLLAATGRSGWAETFFDRTFSHCFGGDAGGLAMTFAAGLRLTPPTHFRQRQRAGRAKHAAEDFVDGIVQKIELPRRISRQRCSGQLLFPLARVEHPDSNPNQGNVRRAHDQVEDLQKPQAGQIRRGVVQGVEQGRRNCVVKRRLKHFQSLVCQRKRTGLLNIRDVIKMGGGIEPEHPSQAMDVMREQNNPGCGRNGCGGSPPPLFFPTARLDRATRTLPEQRRRQRDKEKATLPGGRLAPGLSGLSTAKERTARLRSDRHAGQRGRALDRASQRSFPKFVCHQRHFIRLQAQA